MAEKTQFAGIANSLTGQALADIAGKIAEKTQMKMGLISVILFLTSLIKFDDVKSEFSSIPEGKWIMCKSICDGIETSRNECLEFTFQENGKGSLKKPGEESDFDWKLKDEYIEFNFHNNSDKKLFFSNETIFIFETYKFEKVQIKLTSENSKCYYLLIENN